eukprot:907733-Rhodomonas_salina.1
MGLPFVSVRTLVGIRYLGTPVRRVPGYRKGQLFGAGNVRLNTRNTRSTPRSRKPPRVTGVCIPGYPGTRVPGYLGTLVPRVGCNVSHRAFCEKRILSYRIPSSNLTTVIPKLLELLLDSVIRGQKFRPGPDCMGRKGFLPGYPGTRVPVSVCPRTPSTGYPG